MSISVFTNSFPSTSTKIFTEALVASGPLFPKTGYITKSSVSVIEISVITLYGGAVT